MVEREERSPLARGSLLFITELGSGEMVGLPACVAGVQFPRNKDYKSARVFSVDDARFLEFFKRIANQ